MSKQRKNRILLVAPFILMASAFFSGCFSTLVRWNGQPSSGQAIGAAALDIVTAPIQLIWAGCAGLSELEERHQRRIYQRKIDREVKKLRKQPDAFSAYLDAIDVWEPIPAQAIARIVEDASFPMTTNQLVKIDEIWQRQDARLSQGKGGWRVTCPGLWKRPEWTAELLAPAWKHLTRYMRKEEWPGYASNTNTPLESLDDIISMPVEHFYAYYSKEIMATPEIARSNMLSRVARGGDWLETLRARYGSAEDRQPARLATDGEIESILEKMFSRTTLGYQGLFKTQVFGTAKEARDGLLLSLGEWSPIRAIPRRTPGDLAVGDECYTSTAEDRPDFLAFIRFNVLLVAKLQPDSSTEDLVKCAQWIDREILSLK